MESEVIITSSGPGGFHPEMVTISAGDSIVWRNSSPDAHTIAAHPGQSVQFRTGVIPPGGNSGPMKFERATNQSGVEYYSLNSPTLEGHLVVRREAIRPGPVPFLSLHARNALRTFPNSDWNTMIQLICANWVLDVASDFVFAMGIHGKDDTNRVSQAYTGIESWWQGLLGDPAAKITDLTSLNAQSQARLEVLGRKLRLSFYELKPLVFRSPFPDRPDDLGGPGVLYPGQSKDEFGEAITVNFASDEVRRIEPLEEAFAGGGFRIERFTDANMPIPPETLAAYNDAKAQVAVDHYHILADHQYTGLTGLFGGNQFDQAKFQTGIERMTRRGEWDSSIFTCWHWMRWIQTYLSILETGVLPDMFRPMPVL